MKCYMEIGEQSVFEGVKYKTVRSRGYRIPQKCNGCDLPRELCFFIQCRKDNRKDRKEVYFLKQEK